MKVQFQKYKSITGNPIFFAYFPPVFQITSNAFPFKNNLYPIYSGISVPYRKNPFKLLIKNFNV